MQSAISTVLLPFAGSGSKFATVAENLAVFRVLRVLKLVLTVLMHSLSYDSTNSIK